MNNSSYLGNHLLAEYNDCDAAILNSTVLLKNYMEEAIRLIDGTIIKSVFHEFSPQGVTGVVLLEESHFAIHTWPEYKYAAVDLFTCNIEMDFYKAYVFMAGSLKSQEYDYKSMKRGEGVLKNALK